jgi:hypothetical protein
VGLRDDSVKWRMRAFRFLLPGLIVVAGCKVDLGPAQAGASVVAGQVALASLAPVANVTVKVSGNGDETTIRTGTDGRYSVGSLEGGNYLVEVVPPTGYVVADGTQGLVAVQLNGSDNKTVNFRLQVD